MCKWQSLNMFGHFYNFCSHRTPQHHLRDCRNSVIEIWGLLSFNKLAKTRQLLQNFLKSVYLFIQNRPWLIFPWQCQGWSVPRESLSRPSARGKPVLWLCHLIVKILATTQGLTWILVYITNTFMIVGVWSILFMIVVSL